MRKICEDPLEESEVVIKPVFVIEVKKEDEMIGELRPHLAQNLKQMRHICIQSNGAISEVFGILTNYRHWYFTYYNMETEIKNAMQRAMNDNETSTSQKMTCPFQVSSPINILRMNFKLIPKHLLGISKILTGLNKTFAKN